MDLLTRVLLSGRRSGTVERLHADGLNFKTDAGVIQKIHGITGFAAVDLAMKGEWGQIDDYAGSVREFGVNAMRMFCIWQSLNLSPMRSDYTYDKMHQLGERLIGFGIRPWFVAFCDQVNGSEVRLSATDQDRHLLMTIGVVRAFDRRALIEQVNEDWKNGNIAGRWPDQWFDDVLATTSAPASDQAPEFAGYLTWTTNHTGRDPEQTRRFKDLWEVSRNSWDANPETGAPAHTASGRPALSGEPPRIAEAYKRVNDQDIMWGPREVAQYYAGCDMVGAGAVIHGGAGLLGQASNLQNCVPPTGDALACCESIARVWADGIIPLDANTGDLKTGTVADSPLAFDKTLALRIYSEVQGNKATAVVVEPQPGFQLQAINSWRVVGIAEQDIIYLER